MARAPAVRTRHLLSVAPLAPAVLTVLLPAGRVLASGKMAFTFLAWNLFLAALRLLSCTAVTLVFAAVFASAYFALTPPRRARQPG